jgi:hypothetical protein
MAALASVMISGLMRYRDWAICDPLTGLLNRRGLDEALRPRGAHELLTPPRSRHRPLQGRQRPFGHHRGDEVIAPWRSTIDRILPRAPLPRALAARNS